MRWADFIVSTAYTRADGISWAANPQERCDMKLTGLQIFEEPWIESNQMPLLQADQTGD